MTTWSLSAVQATFAITGTGITCLVLGYVLGVWPHDAYRERDAARAETDQARKATAIARSLHIARIEKCAACPTCTPEPNHHGH